ncbi:MAG: dTDP-glucose 4,6-dehydratase, partial [Vicinamibacterales bacterium]
FDDVATVVGERPGKDQAYLLDSTKARTTLGWHDTVSLEDGLERTRAWIDTYLSDLQAQPMDYVHKP